MNSKDNLHKIIEGVESALSFKQSDFGVLATHYFEMLEEGMQDEIDLYITFKKVEKFVATILPLIKDKVDETKLANVYKKHHVSIVAQNGRSFYDFSNCGDAEFELLSDNQVEINEAIKDREKYLKTITKPTEVIDEDTGEVVLLNPPIVKQSINIVLRYEKV